MIAKEFRALVWPWLATLALLVILTGPYAGHLRSLAIPAYFFGAAALSALSVGHEYHYRTLGVLLAQPLSRARLLRAKVIVLLPMLVTVIFVMWVTSPFEKGDDEELIFWVPIVSVCVGPWMTMICRSAIAGGVFAVGIPGGLLAASNWLAALAPGSSEDLIRNTLFWMGAATVSATGAVLGVRKFFHLEAIDGPDAELNLPALPPALWRFRGASPRFRGPVWMLIKKELRLQQMAFAVSAIYLLETAVAWAFTASGSRNGSQAFEVLSFLYGGLIAPLIGSLASAEERHLGTHDWQVMLPVAFWIQWTIKVTVALTLAMLLAVGLPSLFADEAYLVQTRFIVPIVLITSVAIYVSSRSSSGIHAILVSFAVLPVVTILVTNATIQLWGMTPGSFPPVILVGAALMLLYAGMANHRVARASR